MADAGKKQRQILKITSEAVIVTIVSEPYVILTYRGYEPVVDVKVKGKDENYVMFISSQSLSRALEELRVRNNGNFKGINIRVRKESDDKFAKYIVDKASPNVREGEDQDV
jgi:hypothetical protein